MRIAVLWLASVVLVLSQSVHIGAQQLPGLAGSWVLDRPASTFGPGDPGAERVEFVLSASDVVINRYFASAGGAVWTFPLDGSPPQPPRVGSAAIVDGKLVVTHRRLRELVTHTYTVQGDTLLIERAITTPKGAPIRHAMIYKRLG
jgi:hypothetical protein